MITVKPKGNPRYVAGRRAEYEARDLLIAEGWSHVVRAAGSKGPADLTAVRHRHMCLCHDDEKACQDVLFVSVKRGSGRACRAQRERLAALPGRREIWLRKRGGGFDREVL